MSANLLITFRCCRQNSVCPRLVVSCVLWLILVTIHWPNGNVFCWLKGQTHSATLWAGTNGGCVFIYHIQLPSEERRDTDTVECILGEWTLHSSVWSWNLSVGCEKTACFICSVIRNRMSLMSSWWAVNSYRYQCTPKPLNSVAIRDQVKMTAWFRLRKKVKISHFLIEFQLLGGKNQVIFAGIFCFYTSMFCCVEDVTGLWNDNVNHTDVKNDVFVAAKEIHLKHRAPVISICVLDRNAMPLPAPFEVQNECAKPPDMTGGHSVVICSEEQLKVSHSNHLRADCSVSWWPSELNQRVPVQFRWFFPVDSKQWC